MSGNVSPAEANAQIQWSVSLAADKIFAGVESSPDDVPKADRQFRCIRRFAPQSEFGVEALVFVRLTAAAARVVGPVCNLAIPETRFQPIQGLRKNVAARVRPHVAEMHAEGPGIGHTRGGRLQESDFAPIVRRHGCASRTSREGGSGGWCEGGEAKQACGPASALDRDSDALLTRAHRHSRRGPAR